MPFSAEKWRGEIIYYYLNIPHHLLTLSHLIHLRFSIAL